MYLLIKLEESGTTHRINVHDEFIRDEYNALLTPTKLEIKIKEIAHDLYGNVKKNSRIN